MKGKPLLGTVCLLLASGCATLGTGDTRASVLFDGSPDFQASRAYRRLLKTEKGTSAHEKARIDYLMERLARSPHQFLRDGKVHSNRRAVVHLRWKSWRYRKQVATAEDFVREIATGSRMSGGAYGVRVGNGQYGEIIPASVVFSNELRVLDAQFEGARKKLEAEAVVKEEASKAENTLEQKKVPSKP